VIFSTSATELQPASLPRKPGARSMTRRNHPP
jgi:hypothetical protein